MRKYTDEFIACEISRCKEITGTPTTLRQILRNSKIDRGVFIRYLNNNPDPELLTGEEEKIFNKKMLIIHQKETSLKKYGENRFNNRDKYKKSHYKEDIRNIIQDKASEFLFPVTSKYLSNFLPYNFDVIENYSIYFNIPNILHGEEAKKFNKIERLKKREIFYKNNPDKIVERTKKMGNTKFLKYGNSSYNNRDKITSTLLNKLPPEFAAIYYDKDKSIEFLQKFEFNSRDQICNYFNTTLAVIENWIYRNGLEDYAPKMGAISYKETELRKILSPLGFTIYNSRKILGNGQEIDIYNSKYKIGIEFNGNYWHSDLVKPKNYHFDKSKIAEENGVKLFHFYEWEWDNTKTRSIIISMIFSLCNSSKTNIFAHDCNIKKITNKEAKLFNEINSLQGHKNAQITYGLFYKDCLIQLMSFSKSNKSWKLIRNCALLNTNIINGTNLLFNFFLSEYDPDHIFINSSFDKPLNNWATLPNIYFIKYLKPRSKLLINNNSSVIDLTPKKCKELNIIPDAKIWDAGEKLFIYTKKPILEFNL